MSSRLRLAAAIVLLTAPALAAPTPPEVARRAIDQIRNITRECTERIAAQTVRTVRLIDDLQAQGQDGRARWVAAQAVDQITAEARRCRLRVQETAETGVRALRSLNASRELIEAVRSASVRAQEAIGHSLERGKRQIAAALGG
jgi:chemotaxis response regulator CheB